MLDCRSTVATAACAGAVLAACADPDLPTDLRTSGPPNVTVVTVMSDQETDIDPSPVGIGRIVETATYCRLNDEKRPSIVGLPDIRIITVCPEDLTKPAVENGTAAAVPSQWFIRIVFDKLLDPRVEDLEPVLDGNGNQVGNKGTFRGPNMTLPVTLKCNGADIAYNGYYVPNGNRQSWPLGPALYVAPLNFLSAPVGSTCTVSIKDTVHSKRGESVPANQRDYTFKILPMQLRFAVPDPADAEEPGDILQSPKVPLEFFFTAALKHKGMLGSDADALVLTTLDKTKVQIISGPNDGVTEDDPDGVANAEVCAGTGGTAVPEANIRAYLRGTAGDTTALVMRLDAGGPTAKATQVWQPATTYRVEFLEGASVAPDQGGADAPLPVGADHALCFHTSAM